MVQLSAARSAPRPALSAAPPTCSRAVLRLRRARAAIACTTATATQTVSRPLNHPVYLPFANRTFSRVWLGHGCRRSSCRPATWSRHTSEAKKHPITKIPMIVPPPTRLRSAITALPLSSYHWIVQKRYSEGITKPIVFVLSWACSSPLDRHDRLATRIAFPAAQPGFQIQYRSVGRSS